MGRVFSGTQLRRSVLIPSSRASGSATLVMARRVFLFVVFHACCYGLLALAVSRRGPLQYTALDSNQRIRSKYQTAGMDFPCGCNMNTVVCYGSLVWLSSHLLIRGAWVAQRHSDTPMKKKKGDLPRACSFVQEGIEKGPWGPTREAGPHP